MSERQTLQSIWSITDKPLIDIMTTKHRSNATPIQQSSDDSSDSESVASSRGSFVAVPEEFRPNLSPQLKKQKDEANKMLHIQNLPKPFIHNQNSEFNRYPRNKVNYSPPENLKHVSVRPKQKVKPANEDASSETCSQNKTLSTQSLPKPFIQYTNPAFKKYPRNKVHYSPPEHSKHVPVRHKQRIMKSANEDEDENSETCSQNKTLPTQNLPKPFIQYTNSANKIHYSPPENSKRVPVKHKQRIMKSSDEDENYETCSQELKNMPSDRNIKRDVKTENCKTFRPVITSDEMEERVVNNSLPFGNQCQVSVPKTSTIKKPAQTGLQYEHVKKKHGTIELDYDFSLPLVIERNCLSKETLKYEATFSQDTKPQRAIILKNENINSHSKTRVDNSGEHYQFTSQESFVKWDSTLSLNEQNEVVENKIKWTVVTRDKTAVSSKGKRNIKENIKYNNESKSKNFNQMRKPVKRNTCQRKCDCPLQERINEQNNKKVLNYSQPKLLGNNAKEIECSPETPFYKNNIQPDSNLNFNKTKINNSNTKIESLSIIGESFMQKCSISKQNITGDDMTGVTSQKNAEELNSDRKFYSDSKLNSDSIKVNENEKQKSILQYGKDISDLIIGSHTALSMFIPLYEEWNISRCELIKHFESLERNLKESSKNCTKYKDIIALANTSATIATAIPHPYVSLAAKIISALTGLFSSFLKNKANGDNMNDTNDITSSLFRDTDASTELYMYGLQCNQQFEETTKLIAEFHSKAEKEELFATENREIAKFIQGMLEYRPTHRIFYKKLHKCFQELLQTCISSHAKDFCEPFMLYPSTAVDVIGYLDWRFRYEEFNSESVRYELEQLHQLIQNNNTTSLTYLVQRIQNCIRILKDELKFVERCLKDISLFGSSPEHSITKDGLDFSKK